MNSFLHLNCSIEQSESRAISETLEKMRNYTETVEDRLNCCEGESAEARVSCLKRKIKVTLEGQQDYLKVCLSKQTLIEKQEKLLIAQN